MINSEIHLMAFLFLSLILFASFLVIYPIRNYITISPKRTLVYTLISSLLYGVIITYVRHQYGISSLVLSIFFLPLFFYLFYRHTSLDFFKLLFVFGFSSTLISFPAIYARFINYYIYGAQMTSNNLGPITAIIFIAWEILFSLGYYFYFHKPYQWLIESFHNHIVLKVLWLYPALYSLIIININPDYHQLSNPIELRHSIDKLNLVLLTFVFTLFILYQVFKEIIFNRNLRSEKELLQIQLDNYQREMDYIDDTRRVQHDFRHHMATLSGLLKAKNYDEMDQYLQKYLRCTTSTYHQFTENYALNSILNHYYSQAKQLQIDATFNIFYPAKSPINDIDFCSIIGNLIENAIEGCQSITDGRTPFISVDIMYSLPDSLVASVKNNHNHKIIQQSSRFISTKKNHRSVGLESVGSLVNLYGGILAFDYDHHQFTVNLSMSSSKQRS